MSSAGHLDIACPQCRKRVAGCRCAAPDKAIELDAQPCDACRRLEGSTARSFIVKGDDGSPYWLVGAKFAQAARCSRYVLDSTGPKDAKVTRFPTVVAAQAAIDATVEQRGGERGRNMPPGGRQWWTIHESDLEPTDDAVRL